MDKLTESITLRDVENADLAIFFEHQSDAAANYMVAFTSRDPSDRDAFTKHWQKILEDQSNTIKTILYNGQVAGNVSSFDLFGDLSVGYWLGKEFWGKGIATEALRQFLEIVTTRPLSARVAKDNTGSIRVLQKCGFVITGEDKGFANARNTEIEEYILTLKANE